MTQFWHFDVTREAESRLYNGNYAVAPYYAVFHCFHSFVLFQHNVRLA